MPGSGRDREGCVHVAVRCQRAGDRKVAYVQLVHAGSATRRPRGSRVYKAARSQNTILICDYRAYTK